MYSVFGMNGISFRAPDSRMNRMKGMRFTRNRQNTRSFGKFLAGNPMRPLACADIVVPRSPPISFPDLKHLGAFFSKLKFRVLCYS